MNTPREDLLRPALPKGEMLGPQWTRASHTDRRLRESGPGLAEESDALARPVLRIEGCDLPHDSRERPALYLSHKGEP